MLDLPTFFTDSGVKVTINPQKMQHLAQSIGGTWIYFDQGDPLHVTANYESVVEMLNVNLQPNSQNNAQ